MTERYGLKADVIEKIQAVLARFETVDAAILYGSRAKGNFKPGSDIDLTLKVSEDAPRSLLADVTGAIDDLDLIYTFDISLLHHIKNENLLDHIKRVGVEFYNAAEYAKNQQAEKSAPRPTPVNPADRKPGSKKT
jgi:type I restriction enzyme R subunit